MTRKVSHFFTFLFLLFSFHQSCLLASDKDYNTQVIPLLSDIVKKHVQKFFDEDIIIKVTFNNRDLINNMNEDLDVINRIKDVNVNVENASFELKVEANKNNYINISGRFSSLLPVPVLKRNKKAGNIIEKEDIFFQYLEKKSTYFNENILTKSDQIIGKQLKFDVKANSFFRKSCLVLPKIVNSKSVVSVIFEEKNLKITTKGTVLDKGAVGEIIRVKIDKAIIKAIVLDKDTVVVVK